MLKLKLFEFDNTVICMCSKHHYKYNCNSPIQSGPLRKRANQHVDACVMSAFFYFVVWCCWRWFSVTPRINWNIETHFCWNTILGKPNKKTAQSNTHTKTHTHSLVGGENLRPTCDMTFTSHQFEAKHIPNAKHATLRRISRKYIARVYNRNHQSESITDLVKITTCSGFCQQAAIEYRCAAAASANSVMDFLLCSHARVRCLRVNFRTHKIVWSLGLCSEWMARKACVFFVCVCFGCECVRARGKFEKHVASTDTVWEKRALKVNFVRYFKITYTTHTTHTHTPTRMHATAAHTNTKYMYGLTDGLRE